MCEFCPIVGRCCVCEHYTTPPLTPSRPAAAHPQRDQSGYIVTLHGVGVRFDRHSDAMACLKAFPYATVS